MDSIKWIIINFFKKDGIPSQGTRIRLYLFQQQGKKRFLNATDSNFNLSTGDLLNPKALFLHDLCIDIHSPFGNEHLSHDWFPKIEDCKTKGFEDVVSLWSFTTELNKSVSCAPSNISDTGFVKFDKTFSPFMSSLRDTNRFSNFNDSFLKSGKIVANEIRFAENFTNGLDFSTECGADLLWLSRKHF